MKRTLFALAVCLSGCSLLTEPRAAWPSNVYAFAPDAAYGSYWRQMEECSGIHADFGRVSWYRADGQLDYPGLGAFGVSDWRSHRIALDGRYLDDAVLVRHEILHELLQRDDHPEEYFGTGGRCVALVSH